MFKSSKNILWFKNISLKDVLLVGGKNAALGEMFSNLKKLGINMPDGFAVTAKAYNLFIKEAGLKKNIEAILGDLDTKNICQLKKAGVTARQLIINASLPPKLERDILNSYQLLAKKYGDNPDVAVRSSATAEDLPGASFAGQQETYLNIRGDKELLLSVKKCFASLFTDRALSYRADKGFPLYKDIALSVAVQKMIRSDLAASGVAFTNDVETGFDKVIIINSSYGLGESVVQGAVIPDEFTIFKPTLDGHYDPIIAKNLGSKAVQVIYSTKGSTKTIKTPAIKQQCYSLKNDEVIKLAQWCVVLEKHFSKKYGWYQPMDIEWAKDGQTKELFILQARPETVHSIKNSNEYEEYKLKKEGEALATGAAIGSKIAVGKARVIKDAKDIHKFKKDEVLVNTITDPDWEPIMKIATAIVTYKGGSTSHDAIVYS
ncbi:MAG: PEP/pyruvate-binding domain-containing protein [Patescibacteria group bacterium]